MKKLFFAIFILFSTPAYSIIELNGEFGYQKQVYGSTRQNDVVTRTYAGSIALYFLTLTALELNYSLEDNITSDHSTIAITGTGYSIIGMQNRVTSSNYGVGLRQALAPRNAWLRPTISLGYARQFVNDQTFYTFQNDTNKVSFESSDPIYKRRTDSVFATFGLQLSLTKTLGLRFSVNTLFPAFEFDLAQDNMKYLAGFTWYL
ncbi:MAG: hypothetical protein Fur0010_04960 [Bdellovibrio sp.]